ncbi:MAG: MBL fold metallo-hydrolase [Ignavibacteria bacterium]|jgi:glyoxylase-like metal-dependent hydrolase (beta-lactamase superfamily II)/rhodanese-related sulfurtransferase|nr:MBL fold metallo-hydrolase [Ignavibacteria bacterium]MCU7503958.1 MBL fold metallo-hydrolase [Ignavibacteria bacterium]MCU7515821.1 MBL fold metallo-hydrolase [Ignavibacteria bacterium]
MIFRQIRSNDGTGTLTYLIADERSKKAVVIDPNIEDLERILYTADELELKIEYVIDTHTHADHISAAGEIKKLTGAKVIMHTDTKNKWKVVDEGDKFGIGNILRANAKVKVDRYVGEGDVIKTGGLELNVLFTPGHTDNHVCLRLNDMLFTGDLLLVGQAGRSDLPGGNPSDQYDSLFNKILGLPGDTKIYPGHDYENNQYSLLSEEKKNNPFLKAMTKDEYIEFAGDFFPPIAEEASNSGKMTLQCGTKRVSSSTEPFMQLSVGDLAGMIEKGEDLLLLDVREPFELLAFGMLPGVKNIPTGEITGRINEIPKDKKVVVICQSGNRSYEVSHYLSKKGFSNIFNLQGGTSAWMQKIEKTGT